jgi:predicted ribosomally synthesized peptide with SipW-like signal peptide
MGDKELSRRKVLSGLVATGGAGALAGRGTTALFSDEETFTGNSIKASGSTAGVVDISVDINSMDRGVEYEITLPDDEFDLKNNPSYIWVRTTDCPGPGADALRVQLRFCGETILTGSAREVLDYLVSGVSLACPDSEACLDPGDTVSLQFDVIEVVGDNSFDSLDFDLEFTAQQCRYEEALENPFEQKAVVDDGCDPGTKGISFIAFCPQDTSESLGESDASIETFLAEEENSPQPTSVVWNTTFDVKYVVVYAGSDYTVYDYTGISVQRGVATSEDETAAEYTGGLKQFDPANSCVTGKCGTGKEPIRGCQKQPCNVAAAVLNLEYSDTDYDCPDGDSIKLEWKEDKNEFEVVDS